MIGVFDKINKKFSQIKLRILLYLIRWYKKRYARYYVKHVDRQGYVEEVEKCEKHIMDTIRAIRLIRILENTSTKTYQGNKKIQEVKNKIGDYDF